MTDQRLNLTGYLDQLKARPRKDVQPTLWQEWGRETAELFKEPEKTALYARLFKRHDQAKLRECREWVLKGNFKNPAAVFMATYRKFLNPQPFKRS